MPVLHLRLPVDACVFRALLVLVSDREHLRANSYPFSYRLDLDLVLRLDSRDRPLSRPGLESRRGSEALRLYLLGVLGLEGQYRLPLALRA